MKIINYLINQANLELDKAMPEFLEKFKIVKDIVDNNSKENPVITDSSQYRLLHECCDAWVDMVLAWPLIKFRNPELYNEIHSYFGGEPSLEETKTFKTQ